MELRTVKKTGHNVIGRHALMQDVREMIERTAKVDLPALITGETGTGKGLAAKEIHLRSARAAYPFVSVNMGVLAPELMVSELFGHKKGAFTGAVDNRTGRFEEAEGGTLFLDEIATMNDRVQVALLRVLEEGRFRPLAGTRDKEADVRLVAATNENLEDAVAEGRFREDLYYRLRVLCIQMPTLRDRPSDIPRLCNDFLLELRDDLDFHIEQVTDEAMEAIQKYEWPGNVRELRNALAQAAVMCDGPIIDLQHLPARVTNHEGSPQCGHKKAGASKPAASASAEEEVDFSQFEISSVSGGSHTGIFLPHGMALEEAEMRYIAAALDRHQGNKAATARELGISRKALYAKLNRWQPNGEGSPPEPADTPPSEVRAAD